jgi:predicted GIY-YIG superfamily endonuclease
MEVGEEKQDQKVDDFIGQRFGEDGQLEVIGWDGSRSYSNKVYTVKCHICSQDSELFGLGLFKSTKAQLKAGQTPCGCAKQHYWSKDQYEIKIQRICADRDFVFIGFSEKWEGNKTRVNLRCNKDGNEWSCTISTLLFGIGCPQCRNDLNSLLNQQPLQSAIADFQKTGAFMEGTIFTRSSRKNSQGVSVYWNVHCPLCSNDEYVAAGVCDGVFEADGRHLKRGVRPCRCSKSTRWTLEQYEYRIKNIIEKERLPYRFVEWSDVSETPVKFTIRCEHHGVWEANANTFINTRSRCPDCAITGFKRNKDGYVYVLQVKGPSTHFTGYGITNNIEDRLRSHVRNTKEYGLSVVNQVHFKMDGETAYSLEKEIKNLFPVVRQEISGFRTEATHYSLYEQVVSFISYKQNLKLEVKCDANI